MDGNIGLQENVNIPEKANGFLSFPKNGFGLRLHVKLCRPLASGENVVCSSLSLNEGYYSYFGQIMAIRSWFRNMSEH